MSGSFKLFNQPVTSGIWKYYRIGETKFSSKISLKAFLYRENIITGWDETWLYELFFFNDLLFGLLKKVTASASPNPSSKISLKAFLYLEKMMAGTPDCLLLFFNSAGKRDVMAVFRFIKWSF
jgi:hypothetical protein